MDPVHRAMLAQMLASPGQQVSAPSAATAQQLAALLQQNGGIPPAGTPRMAPEAASAIGHASSPDDFRQAQRVADRLKGKPAAEPRHFAAARSVTTGPGVAPGHLR